MIKSKVRKFSLLLGLCMIFCMSNASDNLETDKKEVVITSLVQKLEFYTKKGNLEAKLSVFKNYESLSTSGVDVSCNVFFDNNSEVKKIRRDGRKKIEPIISDYTSEGIFHSDLKVCHFEYPIERKGEELELSYEKVFTDVKFLNSIYFGDVYDVNFSEVIIVKPDWLELDLVQWNFEGFDVNVSKEPKGKKTLYTYTQKNIISTYSESNTPRNNKIFPHIIPVVNAYKDGGNVIDMMRDVSDLYNWYSSLVKEIGNDNSGLKNLVAEIISEKKEDNEKVAALFYWVQDNIRYVAFEYGIMGFRPEACQNVYYDKFGDCKGMANLLKEMLLIAGYDARLSWIGTNDLPYDYSIPSLIVDNHMICTVVLEGKDVFLDPTEKHSDLFNYGSRIEGRPILIEEGETYRVEQVPHGDKTDVELSKYALTIEDEKLIGRGSLSFSGDRKTRILSYISSIYKEEKTDFVKQYIRKGNKNILISLSKELSTETREKDYIVDYSITMNNRIVNLAGELYINPEIDYPFKGAKLKDDRVSPFQISGQGIDLNQTSIEIPAGWKVSYLPKSILINSDNFNVNMSLTEAGNVIKYHREIEVLNTIVYPKDFTSWNGYIDSIEEFYSDQIILVKK